MSFVSGTNATAFGLFDGDPQFRSDADKLVTFVARKLGEAHVQVELSSSDVYTSFEEAAIDYSMIVNSYQAKSSLAAILGSATGSLTGQQNRYPQNSLEWARRQAQAYSEEAGTGGTHPLYSGSVGLQLGQQNYDLQALINPTGSDGHSRRMIIRDIFHFSPMSAYRFFGTTSAINYLNNEFSFESYTPETIFYLLPIWEDVLRSMQFKMSNKVRRSNYSYELHNNVLKLYPSPTNNVNLHFTYQLIDEDPYGDDASADGVANMSNVPFGNIDYSKLNSISKTWIWKMTYSLCKEIMGLKRRKTNMPIPNGELQLDGDSLVSEAKSEIDGLRSELKDLLESMTYDKIAAQQAEQTEALNRVMKNIPLLIYVG